MKIIHIKKEELTAGLERSRSSYRLAGPVMDQGTCVFRTLQEGELPDLTITETALSPKSIVFPQQEVMFTYTTDEQSEKCNILEEVPGDHSPVALVGIKPCDAKALSLVKLNYDTCNYQDPYFVPAFEACTFIGLAENSPAETSFTTACGTGPFDRSCLDVLLVDCTTHFLAEVLTEKGSRWLESAGFDNEAEPCAKDRITRLEKKAESTSDSGPGHENILKKDSLELFHADHWERTAFACINCGACTYSCPTCWCFDIQDETMGFEGRRVRQWDSCMTSLFTMHASGHNPREHPWQRTRQRFMHKLKYFPDKYNQGLMCVGCGRCIKQCPSNIDIREIIRIMNS